MALTLCKECRHQISKSARACPSCGAKIKRTTLFTKVVAGFLGFIVLSSMYSASRTSSENHAQQQRLASLSPEQRLLEEAASQEQERARVEAEQQRLGLKWTYQESADEMGRGTIKSALVSSLNEVEFDFPYSGAQRATLQLRDHPKHGVDVILFVQKGQFLCEYSGCNVEVRFGDGTPQTFRVSEPSDRSTTVLFIQNHDRFIANAKKVEKIAIEARFYQEGSKVFQFDVSGLKWP